MCGRVFQRRPGASLSSFIPRRTRISCKEARAEYPASHCTRTHARIKNRCSQEAEQMGLSHLREAPSPEEPDQWISREYR